MISRGTLSLPRRTLARFFLAIFAAASLLVPAVADAKESVPRKYAGIVMDAKSGKVLYESAADAARYPASVTKVMTLYVLFQELAAGNIKLTDKMTVSKHAAAAVPTKLGLKAGTQITVENAIKAIVTLSANDMARVIAEHISGSESKFAERMTATAKALGMKRTTYRNASGLPDARQVTTVRDQAILGIAIYQHFPDYYEYFQTRSFKYGKRTYGNHNRLLGERGVDGIKTGYTNASGFNLLTASRQDGHHIVVVGFGFDSSGSRDAKVREQVKKYLPKSRSGGYLDVAMIPQPGRKGSVVQVASAEAVAVVPMPYPAFRLGGQQTAEPVIPADATMQVAANTPDPAAVAAQLADPIIVASIDPDAPLPAERRTDLSLQPAVQATALMSGEPVRQRENAIDVIGAWLSETFSLGAEPAPLGQTRPSAPLLPPVGIGEGGEAIDPMVSGSVGEQPQMVAMQAEPAPLAQPAPVAAQPKGWAVQIGAPPTEEGAASLLSSAAGTVASLGSFQPYIERIEKDGQVFYRARFVGFGGRDDATAMCSELKKAKLSCLAMQS